MRNYIALSAGTALFAGVLSAISATPVQAQSASFSSSATIINPSTFTTTVSGERVVSGGREFQVGTNFTAIPSYGITTNIPANFNTPAVTGLNLGVLNTQVPVGTSSFTTEAANALTGITNGNVSPANVEAISAIIRAGAGVDGLD